MVQNAEYLFISCLLSVMPFERIGNRRKPCAVVERRLCTATGLVLLIGRQVELALFEEGSPVRKGLRTVRENAHAGEDVATETILLSVTRFFLLHRIEKSKRLLHLLLGGGQHADFRRKSVRVASKCPRYVGEADVLSIGCSHGSDVQSGLRIRYES